MMTRWGIKSTNEKKYWGKRYWENMKMIWLKKPSIVKGDTMMCLKKVSTHQLLLATVLYLVVSQPLRQWVKWNEHDWESLGDHSDMPTLLKATKHIFTTLLSVAVVNVAVIYMSWADAWMLISPHPVSFRFHLIKPA